MPYIKPEERKPIDITVEELMDFVQNCGQLNYAISKILHCYLEDMGLRYANINEIIGVLECAKLELYRRIASPYEEKKKKENGPVSELDSTNLEDVR